MKWFSARATSAIVPLLLLFTFSNMPYAEAAPIVINTVAELQAMNSVGDYVLGRDIDAAGFNFIPIQARDSFDGTLNGNNYTISNLTISWSTYLDGLFNDLRGSVTNLGIVNANIGGDGDFAGTVAGVLDGGTIKNSYSTGSVSGHAFVGGLVGWNAGGQISQSHSSASVSGNAYSGGLVEMNEGSIMQSYAMGSVTGGVDYEGAGTFVGGLVGANDPGVTMRGGSISQSYATGALTGTSGYVGGLTGQNYGWTGLGGNAYLASITNSYWDTSTTGRSNRTGTVYPEVYTNISGTQGLTTSQLKSGTLPAGFDPTIWSATPGQYPQLRLSATEPSTTELSATTAAILSNLDFKQPGLFSGKRYRARRSSE